MNVPLNIPQIKLIHGDAKSNSIAAASIVAKVFRDNLMDAYGEVYQSMILSTMQGMVHVSTWKP